MELPTMATRSARGENGDGQSRCQGHISHSNAFGGAELLLPVVIARQSRAQQRSSNSWLGVSYGSVDVEDASDAELKGEEFKDDNRKKQLQRVGIVFLLLFFSISAGVYSSSSFGVKAPLEKGAWSSIASPFSTVSPLALGILGVSRPAISSPGAIFKNLASRGIPLPTNSWCENFFLGSSNTGPENKVFQVPYILDTAGPIQGVRTHGTHVQANDRAAMMTYELENGLTLGAVEAFHTQHEVLGDTGNAIARLAIVLEWKSEAFKRTGTGAHMSSPIVRGAPYTSMQYNLATPRLIAQRFASSGPVADEETVIQCGEGVGVFGLPIHVKREIRLQFDTSDMTWLVFVSEPMDFVCSNTVPPPRVGPELPPGVVPPPDASKEAHFELKAISPVRQGMVRVALGNNCTTGQNPIYCTQRQPRDQSAYMALLRDHSDIYPTGKADIRFTFPVLSEVEEETRLLFNWAPASMSALALTQTQPSTPSSSAPSGPSSSSPGTSPVPGPPGTLPQPGGLQIPRVELLMFATPHHQERLRAIISSSNAVQHVGCTPTIHGPACPVLGGTWSLVEHLHRTSFHSTRSPRLEMLPDILAALEVDLEYQIPDNYMRGAGDTYFSGKMLAKLGRILIIADEVGVRSNNTQRFDRALARLRAGVEIWLNGSAESPLLYDEKWGGLVMCGCDYDGKGCKNRFPDCPALNDMGTNFGAGFYNDHHYHFGYHIYAAAVVAKFDAIWCRAFYQNVLLLIRDIANPSAADPHFPSFRHKDWFLGFSWASGIVTISGNPYPNGRNQESSSEAIAAYEAVALFGEVAAEVYRGSGVNDPEEMELFDASERIRDMGRLLLATEIRSAKTYWHVQAPNTPGVSRIYPEVYEPKVVGMLWSMLAQEQTWFGSEPWKSYGIQLMPLTVAAEQRDSPGWVREMLPIFNQSCATNPMCEKDGWSVLVLSCLATLGRWKEARDGIVALPPSVFEAAGGNGHSLSNSLWYIATRDPEPDFNPN